MTVNDTAIANATVVRELLDEVDTFLDWERDPLRYLFATVCTGVGYHVVWVRRG